MQKQLQERLTKLQAEFEAGQNQLAELDSQQNTLRETLLRISGAIQVLEEELNKSGTQTKISTSVRGPSSSKKNETKDRR